MPCSYFRRVKDARRKSAAGVLGYCVGYCDEKLRIPSVREYERYCNSERQDGCAVYDYRAREEGVFVEWREISVAYKE